MQAGIWERRQHDQYQVMLMYCVGVCSGYPSLQEVSNDTRLCAAQKRSVVEKLNISWILCAWGSYTVDVIELMLCFCRVVCTWKEHNVPARAGWRGWRALMQIDALLCILVFLLVNLTRDTHGSTAGFFSCLWEPQILPAWGSPTWDLHTSALTWNYTHTRFKFI